MVEKIIINPDDVRAYGNIFNEKKREEFIALGMVNVVSLGNQTVNGETHEVFSIKRTDTSLTASNQTVYVGTGSLSATLKNENNEGISSQTVTLKVNNTTLEATTNSSGVASFNLSSLPAGNYTGYLKYEGSVSYAACDKQVNITVNKYATTLAMTSANNSLYPTQSNTLTFTLQSGNTGINGASIDIYANESYMTTVTTNSSGVATYSISWDTEGTRNVYGVFEPTDTYLGSTGNSVNITVTKITTNLTITSSGGYYDSNSFSATLKDSNNTVLGGKSVKFTLKNTSTDSTVTKTMNTDSTGVASFNKNSQLTAGNYTITVDYAGSTIYKNSTITGTFTINKRSPKISISLSKVKVTPTETSVATITLKDHNNNPLNGYSVKLYEGTHAKATLTTDSNGEAIYDLTYDTEGTRAIKARFDGNDMFTTKTSSTVNLQVVKHTSAFIASDVSKTYWETKTYTVRLKDTEANTYISNANVLFSTRVDGTTYGYTAITDSDGYATWNIGNNIPGGTHTLSITYDGSTTIAGVTKNVTLTVGKVDTRITVPSLWTVNWLRGEISATLQQKDGENNYIALPNKTVVLTVNGKNYSSTSDSGGVVKWGTKPLDMGTYNASLSFTGDTTYNASSNTGTIEVTTKKIVDFIVEDEVYQYPTYNSTNYVTVQIMYNDAVVPDLQVYYDNGIGGTGTLTTNNVGKVQIPFSLGSSEVNTTVLVDVPETTKYAHTQKTVNVHFHEVTLTYTQINQAQLKWTLKDSSGPLSGETITVTSLSSGISTTLTTDSNGQVTFTGGNGLYEQDFVASATINGHTYTSRWKHHQENLTGKIFTISNGYAVLGWYLTYKGSGAPIPNASITITYPNSNEETKVTNEKGFVHINTNLSGNHTASYDDLTYIIKLTL